LWERDITLSPWGPDCIAPNQLESLGAGPEKLKQEEKKKAKPGDEAVKQSIMHSSLRGNDAKWS